MNSANTEKGSARYLWCIAIALVIAISFLSVDAVRKRRTISMCLGLIDMHWIIIDGVAVAQRQKVSKELAVQIIEDCHANGGLQSVGSCPPTISVCGIEIAGQLYQVWDYGAEPTCVNTDHFPPLRKGFVLTNTTLHMIRNEMAIVAQGSSARPR